MSLTAFQRKRREVKPVAPVAEQAPAPAPKKPAAKKAKDDAKSESV
jgi:hypothetical protein